MTPAIHPDTLRFFEELTLNNNREWFNDNKLRWITIRDSFTLFSQALINALATAHPAVEGLKADRCIYRIYRDLRFSPDKRPYKTHIACFLPIGGDRTQCVPGYYLQVGQGDFAEDSACSMGGGFYMPSSKQLAAIRQEIFYCTDEFKAILHSPGYRRFYGGEFFTTKKLTRPPKGYPADWPDIELLKYRDYFSRYAVPADRVLSGTFFDEAVEALRACVPLVAFILRAIDGVGAE